LKRCYRQLAALCFVALLAPCLPFAGMEAVVEAAPASFSSKPLQSWRVNGTGRAILKVGNTVYVGGSFTRATSFDGAQSQPRSNLAAFDANTGALISTFRADTNGSVYNIQTDGTSLYIAGTFTTVGGVGRSRIAAIDPGTGALRSEFRADANATVYHLAIAEGVLYAAGAFSAIGGTARSRVAAVSTSTGAVDPTFRTDVDDTVLAVAVKSDRSRVYIGGPYGTVNGLADTDISTLDGRTGATVGPDFTGVTGYVDDLELTPDGLNLIAGHSGIPGVGNRTAVFSTANGSRRWRQLVDGDVQGAHLIGDQVFAGFHDGAKGDGASRLAGYDLTTGAEDLTFAPSFDRFMGGWAVDGDASALVVAGSFSVVSGVRVEGFAIFPSGPSTPIVARAWGWEPWRYLDDGSDQGTAWRQPGFNDGRWKSGIGEFGYGDGGERTKISYGSSASNKHVTTYFRRTFVASAPAAAVGMYMRVDDGAVVYLNGVEVIRDNMPSGAIGHTTLAGLTDGSMEGDSDYFAIDPSVLVVGTNTLSVEVHQNSANSNDLTFFPSLVAYGPSAGTPANATTTTSSPATTTTTSPTTTSPTSTSPTTTTTTTSTTTTTTTSTTTTVVPATTTSSTTTSTTIAGPAPTTTLAQATRIDLAPSAPWSYLDDGSDQGTAWRTLAYDDSAWATGVGEFGYGDGDERTVVGFGPTDSRKHCTTYFRARFLAGSVPPSLTLQLRVDDGAVVYVNGVEAARFNMGTGPVNYLTRAPDAIADGGERLDRVFAISPSLIVPGENVIAVEVHQNTLGSSDLTFLASLTGS
jgi:hypothetical protein